MPDIALEGGPAPEAAVTLGARLRTPPGPTRPGRAGSGRVEGTAQAAMAAEARSWTPAPPPAGQTAPAAPPPSPTAAALGRRHGGATAGCAWARLLGDSAAWSGVQSRTGRGAPRQGCDAGRSADTSVLA